MEDAGKKKSKRKQSNNRNEGKEELAAMKKILLGILCTVVLSATSAFAQSISPGSKCRLVKADYTELNGKIQNTLLYNNSGANAMAVCPVEIPANGNRTIKIRLSGPTPVSCDICANYNDPATDNYGYRCTRATEDPDCTIGKNTVCYSGTIDARGGAEIHCWLSKNAYVADYTRM